MRISCKRPKVNKGEKKEEYSPLAEALIDDIDADIEEANQALERSDELRRLQGDRFFQGPSPPHSKEREEANSSTDTDR